ncbi:tyrosine--tRNA ligase [Ethanoligenens harbinense]|uniref:Tyrosine--tRNA ligase n=1 Tax=Ethanoligenens harbinense (strain DSM 18485 / JCM 12961 / CGMCC 1.5033 / YUAN-3) TaxID=663278 RepID=E6U5L1_ETHHY|nr:tyrosine--tRNA ligase [Ethanoligenens harbinense]ADU26770.1 tyrosyl-tRNA synthetase [Ethanoligenens harbinense YUAN-3]AVQ95876.1 tyrosine--tRNA ligase [Ethanoligenens harbinense YUAN-3]AYF38538.1 tyrosine--tRNA ligase [Ethanoligenens harbinense]AYF41285.1 tyrosine--tRNA ligase [Ethanoligenens harbinense]QCN92117.1 tyrosine--tRNA ligase [Ethanoligenens harbinense]
MGVYEELTARGLIAQTTDEEKVRELVNGGPVTFYIGFDPTADSLHVGHFLQMVIMAHMQRAGHRPVAVLGGGTGMVGDPTGRTDMRQMLTPEAIRHNIAQFKKQMERFIDFSDGKALMVNNADWLLSLNYVDFLREVGVHFSINRMLTFECFKTRMERGLSFLEFNYMLMQSYDFYRLFTDYGCKIEFGGDDQWANIIGGVELIRKKTGNDAYGMTFQLLTTSDGKKMGKTQGGAVWLDPEKTSPYDFYQYWRNVEDSNVIRLLKMITFVPLDEIETFSDLEGSELNRAKERLAYEVTKQVHGKEEADKAQEATHALFGTGGSNANMPATALSESDFHDGQITILELLVRCGLAPSRGEARRLIEQGGVSVNDRKITSFSQTFAPADFQTDYIVRKGKKVFHKVTLEN